MYNIKIEDFINITDIKTSFDINDLVHICKRKNNAKRDYLFVNRYQGKHVPAAPSKIISLFDEFVNEVKKNINKSERILVVGFAETATGIAEYLTYSLASNKEYQKSVVYHLQTTREPIVGCDKLISFSEEHSHATNQELYSKNILPKYDRVLFVEDEITTGKTILNFINEFKKLNPDCSYSVASILNWQNEENIKIFNDNNIQRIYLVSGMIKENVPSIDIPTIEAEDLYSKDYFKNTEYPVFHINHNGIENARMGVYSSNYNHGFESIYNGYTKKMLSLIEPTDKIMVIGTEEFMFYPLMIANDIATYFGAEVKYRATTRSPISCNNEKEYEIKDSIMIPSAYDASRKTFLYNMKGDYNKIIVISDTDMTHEFKSAMMAYCSEHGKQFWAVQL